MRASQSPKRVGAIRGFAPGVRLWSFNSVPTGHRMIAAIDSLPDDEREAFDLVRIQGMTQAEAATVLGVSAMTVKRRLNSGLQLLADALADLDPQGFDPDPA